MEPWQQLAAAASREQAVPRVLVAQLRVIRGDHQVTGQHELEATRQGQSVHRGDYWQRRFHETGDYPGP